MFAHERSADSIDHARSLSRTRYCWIVTYLADYEGWNFLWEPVPWQSQFIHVWPNQWHQYGGTFLVPKHAENPEFHFHQQVVPNIKHREDFDMLVPDVEFDWSWSPHPLEPPYIYVFGNQWWPANKWATIEYRVHGATERKYMDQPRAQLPPARTSHWRVLTACDWDFSWKPDPGDPPFIYVFGNQWHAAEKMPTVEYHMPGATDRKFMRYPRAVLLPDRSHWIIPDSIDESEIDFSWVPDPGSPPYIYQFATQHQKTGGPQYHAPGATETKYFDQIRVRSSSQATARIEIDHLDGNAGKIPGIVKTVRYFDNYFDILRRIAKHADSLGHEFIWICSSICDYSDFDWTWHPEQWQATMLHVFASNDQKFGDTFFMHVPTFLIRNESCKLLEWYDINFVDDISVPRRPIPVVVHQEDSHVDPINKHDWLGPLALFANNDCVSQNLVTVPLWRESTKTIVPLSPGASAVIVPKVAVPYIKTQLYDYPYINRAHRVLMDDPLDVVFISNGEHGAEHHYDMLKGVLRDHNACNRLHHIDRVKGRVAAYQAAANQSHTSWFFAVFAKLQVNKDFDWTWQPDRMQQPKHYIFHAYNPVNHLVYGHQAMIAYNVAMTMVNTGEGLDFTLDQPHEVVPIVSGTAYYDNDPWTCWRTAFRECIKLRHGLPDVESEYRLTEWLSRGDGVNGVWSLRGAQDAVRYYEDVKGDFTEIKKSYEWSWLASYAMMVQPELVTQSST